jgi:hypothetical protein
VKIGVKGKVEVAVEIEWKKNKWKNTLNCEARRDEGKNCSKCTSFSKHSKQSILGPWEYELSI